MGKSSTLRKKVFDNSDPFTRLGQHGVERKSGGAFIAGCSIKVSNVMAA